jgi:hypothetical protein
MRLFRFALVALVLVPFVAVAQNTSAGDAAKTDDHAQLNVVHHPGSSQAEQPGSQAPDMPLPSIMRLQAASAANASSNVASKHIVTNGTPVAAADVQSGIFGAMQGNGNYSFPGAVGISSLPQSNALLTVGWITLTSSQYSALSLNTARSTNNGNGSMWGLMSFTSQDSNANLPDITAGYFQVGRTANGAGTVTNNYGIHIGWGGDMVYGALATNNVGVQIDNQVDPNATNNYALRYSGNGGASPFAVLANGSVGVGTTAPVAKLTITDGYLTAGSGEATHPGTRPKRSVKHS